MNRTDGCGVTVSCAAMMLVALFGSPGLAQVRRSPLPLGPLATVQDSIRVVQSILTYMRSPALEFDTLAGDQQRLMLGTCPQECRYGPLARIDPHFESWYPSAAQRDTGRIIARIISEGPYVYRVAGRDTVYKFNIHGRDTVYWWVGPRGGRLVSVFISTARGARPLVSDVVVDYHAPGTWKQALARWLWSDSDETGWGTCDGGACCKSSGLALR